MKVRNGFVSNSSSSSFIVAYRGEKPTAAHVMESCGIAKGSRAAKMFGGVFDALLSAKPIPKEDIADMRAYYPEEEALKLFDAGWTVLRGSAGDEDRDPAELFLCFSSIDLSTDAFRIIKEDGY